jgi:hypothetical protein
MTDMVNDPFTFALSANVPSTPSRAASANVVAALTDLATYVNAALAVPATASAAEYAKGVLGRLEAVLNKIAG